MFGHARGKKKNPPKNTKAPRADVSNLWRTNTRAVTRARAPPNTQNGHKRGEQNTKRSG